MKLFFILGLAIICCLEFSLFSSAGRSNVITKRPRSLLAGVGQLQNNMILKRKSGDSSPTLQMTGSSAYDDLNENLDMLESVVRDRARDTERMISEIQEKLRAVQALQLLPSQLEPPAFDEGRKFVLDDRRIECLTGNADRSNMNNSLSMDFTSRNETLDCQIAQLYKTYDAARLCLSENEALHWLQKLMLKAGISNTPVAIFHSQAGVEFPQEVINGTDTWAEAHGCVNLHSLDRNSSVVYVYNNSCVRLFTELDCQGESFLFTGNSGAGFSFVGNLKYFDKKGRSVGSCLPLNFY